MCHQVLASARKVAIAPAAATKTDVAALSTPSSSKDCGEPRVLIAMITTGGDLKGDFIRAVLDTWVSDIPSSWHVAFFIGGCKTTQTSPHEYDPAVQVRAHLFHAPRIITTWISHAQN